MKLPDELTFTAEVTNVDELADWIETLRDKVSEAEAAISRLSYALANRPKIIVQVRPDESKVTQ